MFSMDTRGSLCETGAMETGTGKQRALALRYCGRVFSPAEMAEIRAVAEAADYPTRAAIAVEVCRRLGWRKPDGGLKAMSCRVALLRMQEDGLVRLPAPTGPSPRPGPIAWTSASDPGPLLEGTRGDLGTIQLVRVARRAESRLWNEVIARHHYLGYQPLAGAQLRYLAYAGDRLLAALGFGASAWRVSERDWFIGWDDAQREARLPFVVNNARFLILPSIHVRCLASSLLGQVSRQLPLDWEARYAYRPLLLESFVECGRFAGTAYRAANWVCVGRTSGHGKLSRGRPTRPIKSVWLYPLHPRFREQLCAPLSSAGGVRF